MTKKHFIALANLLQQYKPVVREETDQTNPNRLLEAGRAQQWEALVDGLADFCESQNANFNRERWLSYIAGTCTASGKPVPTEHDGLLRACLAAKKRRESK